MDTHDISENNELSVIIKGACMVVLFGLAALHLYQRTQEHGEIAQSIAEQKAKFGKTHPLLAKGRSDFEKYVQPLISNKSVPLFDPLKPSDTCMKGSGVLACGNLHIYDGEVLSSSRGAGFRLEQVTTFTNMSRPVVTSSLFVSYDGSYIAQTTGILNELAASHNFMTSYDAKANELEGKYLAFGKTQQAPLVNIQVTPILSKQKMLALSKFGNETRSAMLKRASEDVELVP